MFGWFKRRCPLETYEQAWTEYRMQWLGEKFGWDQLRNVEVITSIEECVGDSFEGSEEQARCLLDWICGRMRIAPSKIGFEVLEDTQLPTAIAHYDDSESTTIRIRVSQLSDPLRLIATLAHELAHELLLGQKRLTVNELDHESVTDLTPIVFGFGLFMANATVLDVSGQVGNMSWWRISKHGYLPSRVFGYALALFTLTRGDAQPAWSNSLRLDAAQPFRDGLRYLSQANDCLFDPKAAPRNYDRAYLDQQGSCLSHASPSKRLAALWDLEPYGRDAVVLLPEVIARLSDADESVRTQAAELLGQWGHDAVSAAPRLADAMNDRCEAVQIAAAGAIGLIGADPSLAIRPLGWLLESDSRPLVYAAAQGICRFGHAGESCMAPLLAAYKRALNICDEWSMNAIAAAIQAVSPNGEDRVRAYFRQFDAELCRMAVQTLREQAQQNALPSTGGYDGNQASGGTLISDVSFSANL